MVTCYNFIGILMTVRNQQMKKILKVLTGIALIVAIIFGAINIFAKQMKQGDGIAYAGMNYVDNANLGVGEKYEVQNPNIPSPLGTTTAFKGSSVTATNTVADKEMDFKIYGHPDFDGGLKIEASRPTTYMVPVDNAYIDTGFVPDEDTTLELYYMLPNSFSVPGAHVTAVGACGTQPYHFGTGFLINNTQIQHLYGAWETNAPMLAARPNSGSGTPYQWKRGEQYYSKLVVGNGRAVAYASQLGDNGWVAAEQISTLPLRADIATQPFNSLFIFGQNNASLVNHYNGGISEVIISKTSTGQVLRHYVAVEQGSTEYLVTPAPNHCMVQLIGTPSYVASNGTFQIQEGNTSTEIDLSIFDLSGNSYTSGNEANGNADYLHIDTKAQTVKWYQLGDTEIELIEANRGALMARGYTTAQVTTMLDIASQLLALKTTSGKTVLSNNQGAWMEGIIGPVVNYTVSGTNVSPVTVNISNFIKSIPQNIVAQDLSAAGVNATIWKAGVGANSKEFLILPGGQLTVTRPADIVLFSSDGILQLATHTGGNNYDLRIDVVYNTNDMTTIKVNVVGVDGMPVPNDMKVRIAGVLYTLAEATQGGLVLTGATAQIVGEFDDVLYRFVAYNTGGSDIPNGGNQIVSLVPPDTNEIVMTYKIEPRAYNIQILGKYTDRVDFDLSEELIDAYSGNPISFNSQTAERVNMSGLNNTFKSVGQLFHESYMRFEESFSYDFSHFEYANGERVGAEIVVSSSTLKNGITQSTLNPSEDAFTIYAIYQKKFILNVRFDFPGENFTNLGTYRMDDNTRTPFRGTVNGIVVENGFLVTDSDAVAVILQPDKRYEVTGQYSWQLLEDNPNVLFVRMDQSNNIVITLKHRKIKVNYGVEINGVKSETMLPAPLYFSDGTAGNLLESHTYISVEDISATTLTVNNDELRSRRYRNDGFFIRDISDMSQLVLVPLAGGILDLSNDSDEFFDNYVDSTGNSYVYLRVVQQLLVNFYTRGFDLIETTNRSLTYSNADLGSYTVAFNKDYRLLDGEYWVDYGTEITITQTTGSYGKFISFTGLTTEENNTASDDSISLTITTDKYVGVNFESTKLPAWVLPVAAGVAVIIVLSTGLLVFFILKANKLKKLKIQREKELSDMKRRFNIADEIAKMREGDFGAREKIK